jgi:hypothetical protein
VPPRCSLAGASSLLHPAAHLGRVPPDHPGRGTLGSFNILEFPEDVHSPVVYAETVAGDAYLERKDEIQRLNLTYTHLHAAALNATKSKELIAAIAKDLA